MLGERVRALQWLGAAVALSGAMVLIQPGGDAFQPMGLVALLSAMLLGLEVVLIKRLSNNNEPAIRILLINNGIGTVLACTAAIPVWQTPPLAQLWIWAAVGLTMVSGQVVFIWVMKRAPASLTVPVFYSTLVFATLYDWLLFAVVPGLLAIAGTLLIVAGLLLPTLWTKADSVPPDANDGSANGDVR
jgi:drug/metabolite transporter (DMT)-like permease